MFLGSNIGNFNRAQAAGFMREERGITLNSGDWLWELTLKKISTCFTVRTMTVKVLRESLI